MESIWQVRLSEWQLQIIFKIAAALQYYNSSRSLNKVEILHKGGWGGENVKINSDLCPSWGIKIHMLQWLICLLEEKNISPSIKKFCWPVNCAASWQWELHAWNKYFALLCLVIFIKCSDTSYYSVLYLYGSHHFDVSPGSFLYSRTFHFGKWLSIWTVRLWKRKQEKIQTKHYFTLTWLDLTSCLCKTRQNIFFPNLTFLTWTWSGNILVFRSLTDYISVILTKDYTEHWIEY